MTDKISSSQISTEPQPEQVVIRALKPVQEVFPLVIKSLDDAKADNILAIDLRKRSALGDYMVIASANSNRHVLAIADRLLRDLKENKAGKTHVEGLENGDWVLVDIGDIIIHIFRQEIRDFYNIEKIWLDENNVLDLSKFIVTPSVL